MKPSAERRFTFLRMLASLTGEELADIEERLDRHNVAETSGRFHDPGAAFNVTVANPEGAVVGGINVSTKLDVMFLEVFWVDDAFRGRGLGGRALLEAERIGREAGCIASQTWTFSFQAPEFYEKLGCRPIGLFDGYPDGITEHVLMKRLDTRSEDTAAESPPSFGWLHCGGQRVRSGHAARE